MAFTVTGEHTHMPNPGSFLHADSLREASYNRIPCAVRFLKCIVPEHGQILSVAHFTAETAVSLVAVRLHTGRRLGSVAFDASRGMQVLLLRSERK